MEPRLADLARCTAATLLGCGPPSAYPLIIGRWRRRQEAVQQRLHALVVARLDLAVPPRSQLQYLIPHLGSHPSPSVRRHAHLRIIRLVVMHRNRQLETQQPGHSDCNQARALATRRDRAQCNLGPEVLQPTVWQAWRGQLTMSVKWSRSSTVYPLVSIGLPMNI